jgi:hypothetical protein
MSVPIVIWDGAFLGDIEPFILSSVNEYGIIRITFRGIYYGTEKILSGQLYHFSDKTPLVVDELKIIFQIHKVGRHHVKYKNKDAILCQDGIECQLSEFKEFSTISDDLKLSIQKNYVFRWIVGLTNNTNSGLRIRITKNNQTCISYREIKVDHNSISSKIPQTVIKEWFNNDLSLVERIICLMIDKRSLIEIRIQIESIIRRIEPEYVWWISYILERIQEKS